MTDTVIDEVIARYDAEHAPRALRYFSAGESLDPLPPIDWTVKHIIRPTAITALVGGAKLGKSLVCAHLGVHVALGRDWLGQQVKQCPVIYLDEENGEVLMRQRMALILHGLNVTDRDIPMYVLPMPRLNFGAKVDRDRLIDFISERGAGLVIVDSLIDVLTLANAKESVAEDQQRVFMGMQDIANDTGAAFTVIHHENRNGTYRGSSALTGAVDTMLYVKGKPGQGRLDFEMELSRNSELMRFAALADFCDDTYTLTAAQAVKSDEPHLSKSQDYVERYLQQHGASTIKAIMSAVDTCTPEAARRAVYSLAAIGRLYRTNPGASGDAIYDRAGVDLNSL